MQPTVQRRPDTDRGDRPEDDVARARAGMRNARVTFGPRTARRGFADSWGNFAGRYGWRAYVLPVLLVITIAALSTALSTANGVRKKAPAAAAHVRPRQAVTAPIAPPTASGSIALKDDTGGTNAGNAVLAAAALPSGAAYTKSGTGRFRVLRGTTRKFGTGRLYRYSVEVEGGITGVDLASYAKLVDTTLADRRSWSGHGVALQRVSSGRIDFRVSLVSSYTVRKLCGYSIPVETSCYTSAAEGRSPVNRVVFNIARWVRGSTAYVGDLATYRVYMINHEDGHALGHMHAHECLPGGLAPVMMQQTLGLKSGVTATMCEANQWPYPTGARGAPGSEQQDTKANDEYQLGD